MLPSKVGCLTRLHVYTPGGTRNYIAPKKVNEVNQKEAFHTLKRPLAEPFWAFVNPHELLGLPSSLW